MITDPGPDRVEVKKFTDAQSHDLWCVDLYLAGLGWSSGVMYFSEDQAQADAERVRKAAGL